MTSLKDKVALITGAASGIGESIAQLFAANGTQLVLVDHEMEPLQKVADRIIKNGGNAMVIKADVSDPAQSERMVFETMKAHDRLDVAVNNAGIGGATEPIGNYPIEEWNNVISVNLSGVFYSMRYQIPAMLRNNSGVIVNVSSVLGSVGYPNSGAYVAAKHGVLGLTKNAALEYATKGIRVNAVCPGFIGTHLLEDNMGSQELKQIAKQHPMQRLGKVHEVAELVLWLASDRASYVTGSAYNVDGGYLAQ